MYYDHEDQLELFPVMTTSKVSTDPGTVTYTPISEWCFEDSTLDHTVTVSDTSPFTMTMPGGGTMTIQSTVHDIADDFTVSSNGNFVLVLWEEPNAKCKCCGEVGHAWDDPTCRNPIFALNDRDGNKLFHGCRRCYDEQTEENPLGRALFYTLLSMTGRKYDW